MNITAKLRGRRAEQRKPRHTEQDRARMRHELMVILHAQGGRMR